MQHQHFFTPTLGPIGHLPSLSIKEKLLQYSLDIVTGFQQWGQGCYRQRGRFKWQTVEVHGGWGCQRQHGYYIQGHYIQWALYFPSHAFSSNVKPNSIIPLPEILSDCKTTSQSQWWPWPKVLETFVDWFLYLNVAHTSGGKNCPVWKRYYTQQQRQVIIFQNG